MSDTPTFPNWFDGQKYNFEDQLTHLAGIPNLNFLQIGAYTGDASVWLCENILTDRTARLLDVDTWAGSDEAEHSQIDFNEVFEYYEERIAPFRKVVRLKMTSDEYFAGDNQARFDFIYIDGDHTAAQVERDAENAWKLLKSGGIIAFDDYLWGQDLPEHTTPKPAIDRFLLAHTNEYQILVDSYQVWLRKK
jgi:predicted O-methyltransferase YrrM